MTSPPPAGDVPTLTLVLPPGLARDQVLAGMAKAVAQARQDVVRLFLASRRQSGEHARQGDQLRQSLCYGQLLAADHAIAKLDEAIIETFCLWAQYDRQVPGTRKINGHHG